MCIFLFGLLVLQILRTLIEMLPLMERSRSLMKRSMSLKSMFLQAVVLSPVESFTRYRNLSVEFKDFFNNNINEDNAVGTLVPAIGQISLSSTNTFSAVAPSNPVASPTYGKSSCIDTSQLPDDPDMLELEDMTYSDDEDDVGAEVDFNNLETSITVSPSQTTRVHKDHHVTQIIGDLSSATQRRSMKRVAKDQGGASSIQDAEGLGLIDFPYGKRAIATKWVFKNKKDERGIVEEVYICQPPGFEDPDYPDKVYKVVKVTYGLHQAPRD
nr:retrotransposon protein, putative, Ty1-copia subclass [Tanacetum cinerariifolium]